MVIFLLLINVNDLAGLSAVNLIYICSICYRLYQTCFDLKLFFNLFCKILGMAQGLNLILGWDLFTCVFLTATGAVFHLLLAVLLVSIIPCVFTNFRWSTLYLLFFLCLGYWEGKGPRPVCGRLCIAFFCTWSTHQSTRHSVIHEWNTNKVEWRECICANESSGSDSCAPQLLPSFLNCTGIVSCHSSVLVDIFASLVLLLHKYEMSASCNMVVE